MKRSALLLALPLAACATVGGLSPAQTLFAADGAYGSALHAARVYSEQPQASAVVIHALNAANRAAQPAHELVIAYKACVVNHATTVFAGGVIAPCVTFDFSAASLSNAAVALRNAALNLQQKVPAR
jgi:hypothetical protein